MLKRNVIYTTTDYEQFAFKSANRDIDPAHVKKIAGRMEQKGWQGGPIEISLAKDGKYQIEEGQHRYMAARQTKTPIRFIVVDEKDVYDTATENSMKKGWNGSDFIHAYASDGNFNYKRLENLENEFPNVTLTDILEVIGDTKHKRENLKKGYIRITDEQFFQAREILKSLQVINECLDNIAIKTVSSYKRIIISLLRHDVIDPQRMIDKLDKHGKMLLPPSATRDQAMQYLEALYNYHQPKGSTVLFREALKHAK